MMSQGVQAQGLRDILRLAKMLRDHVQATDDLRYASLFKQTAEALENRAHELANGQKPPTKADHVDLVC